LDLDIKTVNARFLEIHCRLPEELRVYEPLIRERCQATLGRGKIECRLNILKVSETNAWVVDEGVLAQLLKLHSQLEKQQVPMKMASFLDWIRYPNLVLTPNQSHWEEMLLALLDQALIQLKQRRQQEGEKLKQILFGYLEQMEFSLSQIKQKIPSLAQVFRDKLRVQLQPLLVGGSVEQRSVTQQMIQENNQRIDFSFSTLMIEKMIEAEIVLHETRVDVSEEIDRLQAHLQTLRSDLNQGGALGKKLDFLMQELLRETNTLASKTHDVSVTQYCIAMKLCIEHMREQVQNLV
jgi:uncharacterized protein YicC (UPF0701 family)